MVFNRTTFIPLIPLSLALTVLAGCDSITERDVDVKVNLDTVNLVGTGTEGLQRATVTGNPACTASSTNLSSLLATADNYDDFDEYLEDVDINTVRYRVTQNSTPVDATGVFQMTDPATQQLTTVASIVIPANTSTDGFATFPFVDGGAAIVQHYMDNQNASFTYCAEGSPNSSELNMTIELQLDMNVTIDVL